MKALANLRHGGALDVVQAAYLHAPRPWIDLSTGINPWPWHIPSALLDDHQHFRQLPTQSQTAACNAAMSDAFGTDPSHILPVPGTAMAISLLPTVLRAKSVCVLSGSYGDHLQAWQASGARVTQSADPLAAADTADVIALCNPNNPDGRIFERDDLRQACNILSRRGGTLVVDEAYADIDPRESLAGHVGVGNLIVLRSFGKFYGLAGIRLGAVLGPQPLLQNLAALLGDWPVSSLALKIGSLAYRDTEFQETARTDLAQTRRRLDDILISSGIVIAGGTDLFRLVEVSCSESLWTHLAQRGLYTRRFGWSPKYIRLGVPGAKEAENRLRAALMSWEAP